jgi:hypothetical protein
LRRHKDRRKRAPAEAPPPKRYPDRYSDDPMIGWAEIVADAQRPQPFRIDQFIAQTQSADDWRVVAKQLHRSGLKSKEIAQEIEQRFGIKPSRTTLWRLLRR